MSGKTEDPTVSQHFYAPGNLGQRKITTTQFRQDYKWPRTLRNADLITLAVKEPRTA